MEAAGTPVGAGQTAVVVGGGVSGLLAARTLARAGVRTTVLEASGAWGGCVGSHTVAGLTLDSGAESFATRSSAVADLAAELGIADGIVAPNPGGAWVQLPDGPRELPRTGVLGIPANPWDPEVRRSLGLAGSLRASLDKLLPASLGTTAEATSVAALVRARMGRRVLERLVAPVVGGVHSADPDVLDIDMVAPGLRAGIRDHGSLASRRRRPARGRPAQRQTDGARGRRGGAGARAAEGRVRGCGTARRDAYPHLRADRRAARPGRDAARRHTGRLRGADCRRLAGLLRGHDPRRRAAGRRRGGPGRRRAALRRPAGPCPAPPRGRTRRQPGHTRGGPAPARRQAARHRGPGRAAEPGNPGQGPHPRHRQMGVARRPDRPRHPRCPAVLRTR